VLNNKIFPIFQPLSRSIQSSFCAPANQNGFIEAHHFTPVHWSIVEFGTGKQHGLAGNNDQQEDYADA
jgi:hypothetical protein